MSYIAILEQPQVIGPVAEGLRLNINVTGGTVDGQKIKGKFIPVGWLVLIGLLCVPMALGCWTCELPSRQTTMP
jgi:hypothetical protein